MKATQAVAGIGLALVISGVVILGMSRVRSDGPGDGSASPRASMATPTIGQLDEPLDEIDLGAASGSTPTGWTAHRLDRGDLGTGSTEFSGVALNEDKNRLLIIDDEGQLFEFELDGDGWPASPPRRTIEVMAGAGDTEGIAWITGTMFAIANENDGTVMFVDLDDAARTVSDANVTAVIDTGIAEVDGAGVEGVSTSGDRTFVVHERPARLLAFDRSGVVVFDLLLDAGLDDASDVWVGDGAGGAATALIVSDQSRAVIEVAVGAGRDLDVIDQLSLEFDSGVFGQAEGVVRAQAGDRMYVVGESTGGGYTIGYFMRDG